MFKFLRNYFDPSVKIVKSHQPTVSKIREFIKQYEDKPTSELRRIIEKHREELKDLNSRIPADQRSSTKMRRKTDTLSKAELDLYHRIQEIMPEVYAILSLTTKHKIGIMHFDVQFLAGSVLASGQKLVEMKTGEGKTMTFQLPLFLYGMTGRGAHLVTVNDYLAKRDGEYAGHIFSELGLTVGVITPEASYKFITDAELREVKGEEVAKEREKQKQIKVSGLRGLNLVEVSKKEAYGCDVVVGTNNEFGFDYLRDNMVKSVSDRVQRELYFCIVDEADSILIDEARTPLIISAPAGESNDLYVSFAKLVPKLKRDTDFVVEEKERAVNLTDEGIAKMERLLGVKNIWEDYRLAHHLENALKASIFYRKDKEYIVRGGEVLIVDEFTGRVLAGRRYSEGLHQAIEAQEGVTIQQESRTLATITFQNFFRIYKILCGGSGTIMTEQEEFFKIYNLEGAEIPTNLPIIRKDESDRVYKDKNAKFKAVVREIVEAHETGQPILVGTTSIADSETVSELLDKEKIEHEVLNAKYHEREAQIVAKAGEVKAVTVATNMAGRGTDIPLGSGATEVGGLYVIGTERHEARRIDNQLRGRSGRQGDPGKTRFFVALDDQIMKMQGGEIVQRIMEFTNLPEDLPLEARMISGAIERAQKRMEGMYFDARKHVVEYDDVVNQQREIFYGRRMRYLQLISRFEEAYQQSEEEQHKKLHSAALEELVAEFKSLISDKVEQLNAIALAGGSDKQEESVAELVAALLSMGSDQLFLETANKLKLYKDKLSTVAELSERLQNYWLENIKTPEQGSEFLQKFLRTAIELKLNKVRNHAGLIRAVVLDVLDELWTLHLDYMQDIREGIGLRGVAQLDPLVEYKNEGFTAFAQFISKVNQESLTALLQVSESVVTAPTQDLSKLITNDQQITDLLTGTREIAPAPARGAARGNRNGVSIAGQKLSRKQRRQQERQSKKKRR
jgi:preprotein translocase subunit SecA